MPALYTHYRFSKEVYTNLNEEIQRDFNEDKRYYYLFSQSFDTLYYYNFFKFQVNNKVQKMGHLGHRKNTSLYFKKIINYIIENNLEKNSVLMEYLYGSVNHYVMDCTFHPYVFYKTGIYNKNDKNTYKYNGMHTRFEYMLDAYYYNLDTKHCYKDFQVHKVLFPKYKFDETLKSALDYTFLSTFEFSNMGKYFEKSYAHGHLIYKYVITDKYGIKTKLFTLYDLINKNKRKAYRFNTTYIKNIDKSILNIEKKEWINPINKDITYNDSVNDLYSKALKQSNNLITLAYNVVNKKESINEFLKALGNNSYLTNNSVEKNNRLRYFE